MSVSNPDRIPNKEQLTELASYMAGQIKAPFVEVGDGLEKDENEVISVKEMVQADLGEIVSPLPGVMSRRMKYSTEEQIVGEWIDGKPLYQKTYYLNNIIDVVTGTFSNFHTDLSDLNIDVVVNLNAIVNIVGLFQPLPWITNAKNVLKVQYSKSAQQLDTITDSSAFNNVPYYVTIQYTKTTD